VGIQCNHLEGVFLNILWRKSFYNNIITCFEKANIPIADMYLAPLALADNVLTDSEKRSGCALIDLGADTTTVSVYYKNVLRHLSVVPLGGNNITKDLTCLQIEEQDAERMKLKYAKAYTDIKNIDPSLNYSVDKDRVLESKKFIEIVEARVEEIIENACYQIPTEYADKLLGGIILTGGGCNMPDIEKLFRNQTNCTKVRIAKFVTQTVKSKDPKINSHDGTKNTILGLLAKGDMNCAGEEVSDDLFSQPEKPATNDNTFKAPRNPNETAGSGVVPTPAEKQKREEELRKKKEEEERLAKIAEEEAKEREERKRRENSVLHKGFRKIKKFFTDIVDDEDE
jgi:cell division protein FtsA